MFRVLNLPIESLPERYSQDWQRWFENEFCRLNINHVQINPNSLSDKIQNGSFLDVAATHYYKAKQIEMVSEMMYNNLITDDDVFLFHDLWHPAIESLAYMRDGLGMKFKIVGCLHAGSYDPYDFLAKKGMNYWAEDIENGWFKIVDKIFVATNFHKKLLLKKRKVDPKKIIVTGFPIYYEGKHLPKENIIVFPHRLDSEKNPHLFAEVELYFQKRGTDWKFIRTKDVCTTKQEYYDLLERSKIAVSFADQETWGICMQESLFAGCVPLVPDKLSYTEMYFPAFKYRDMRDFYIVLQSYMNLDVNKILLKEQQEILLKKGSAAIENMIEEMKRL